MDEQIENKQSEETTPVKKRSYRHYRLTVRDLREQIEIKERAIGSLMEEMIGHGALVEQELFIPEYLGFKEQLEEGNGLAIVRSYHRDGGILVRDKEDDKKWLVLIGDFNSWVPVRIENMFQAIVVLRSLGFNVEVKDYVKGEIK